MTSPLQQCHSVLKWEEGEVGDLVRSIIFRLRWFCVGRDVRLLLYEATCYTACVLVNHLEAHVCTEDVCNGRRVGCSEGMK